MRWCRWATHRHVNGVAVFREQAEDNGQGGAMMVSTVVRAAPEAVWKVRGYESAVHKPKGWLFNHDTFLIPVTRFVSEFTAGKLSSRNEYTAPLIMAQTGVSDLPR